MSVGSEQAPRYARLSATHTFRGKGIQSWADANVFVIGSGNTGWRTTTELLISGVGSVTACDPGHTKPEVQGTQYGVVGARKVDSLAEWASVAAPGRLHPLCCDFRQLGIGQLVTADLLIDCTDDPSLAVPTTRISNGLGIPLLRPAIDGSGQSEMGRIVCSHGGGGNACQLCTWEPSELFRHSPRTPCQPQASELRAPTLAGGAIGATIAGMTVLQAQRLVTGNDADQVLNRDWIIDLTGAQLLNLQRQRSDDCLSGHLRWNLQSLPMLAAETTWRQLLTATRELLSSTEIDIEPFGHALCIEAVCGCGARSAAVGTRWATAPDCHRCGSVTQWVRENCRQRLTASDLDQLGLMETPLATTGIPPLGAMFVVRAPDKPPQRFVLD